MKSRGAGAILSKSSRSSDIFLRSTHFQGPCSPERTLISRADRTESSLYARTVLPCTGVVALRRRGAAPPGDEVLRGHGGEQQHELQHGGGRELGHDAAAGTWGRKRGRQVVTAKCGIKYHNYTYIYKPYLKFNNSGVCVHAVSGQTTYFKSSFTSLLSDISPI